MFGRLIREPLLHFLVIGLGLFALNVFVQGGGADNPRVIHVDRPALTTYLQYRAKMFEPERAAAAYEAMDATARQKLAADYVREEALYREARDLGLAQNDDIIKKRLVQKMEFITQGFASVEPDITAQHLEAYFQEHRSDYFIEPSITFTHVFFDVEKRGRDAAMAAAAQTLADLIQRQATFSDAGHDGDRFPYHRNYVERTPDFVASHFGGPMTGRLFNQSTPTDQWVGPVPSEYGYHLVFIADRQPGREATLAEVRGHVYADVARAMQRQKSEEAIQAIIDRYDIRLELE